MLSVHTTSSIVATETYTVITADTILTTAGKYRVESKIPINLTLPATLAVNSVIEILSNGFCYVRQGNSESMVVLNAPGGIGTTKGTAGYVWMIPGDKLLFAYKGEVEKLGPTGAITVVGAVTTPRSANASWHSNDYLAVNNYSSSPYFSWYKFNGTSFDALTHPGGLPSGIVAVNDVSWSPDGVYLLVRGFTTIGFICLYKRSDDTLTLVDTKFTNTAPSSGTGTGKYCKFFPDGEHILCIISENTTFDQLWKRVGDTLTYVTVTAVSAFAEGAAISPDGRLFVICYTTQAPICNLFRLNNGAITSLGVPPSIGLQAKCASFSPDGKYLLIGFDNQTPFAAMWRITNDALTYLSALPSAIRAWGISFSPDGQFAALACLSTTPFVQIYKRLHETWTLVSGYASAVYGITTEWSPDSKRLLVSKSSSSNFLELWIRSGNVTGLNSYQIIDGTKIEQVDYATKLV